jgi:hypothetical protein
MNDQKERIQKGIEYFARVKPSEWNFAHTAHLKIFLDLVGKYLGGVTVQGNTLSYESRIEEAFPKSDEWKLRERHVNAGGLNNDPVVSPNETASHQMEDLSLNR